MELLEQHHLSTPAAGPLSTAVLQDVPEFFFTSSVARSGPKFNLLPDMQVSTAGEIALSASPPLRR